MIEALNKVLKNDLCTGCGACTVFDPAIKMSIDKNGFSRPLLERQPENVSVVAQKQFENVCPGLNLDITPLVGEDYNKIWGEIVSIGVGHATDTRLRNMGSSGGVISGLSKMLLEQNLVDGVINVSELSGITNEVAVRDIKYDFTKSAGSRYAPVSPCEILRDLDKDKTYLFIGKPCDVAAVRQLQRTNKTYAKSIPYLISFFCAGTPSLNSTRAVLDKFNINEKELVEFRYRGDGWPGLTKAVAKDGRVESMTYNESWGKILNKGLQTRCKLCIDGIGEFADVVCADYWECDENGYPVFEEGDGRSLILARTQKGADVLSKALEHVYIESKPIQIDTLKNVQPFQYYRRVSVLARLLAFRGLGYTSPKYKGFNLFILAVKGGWKLNIRSFLGLLMRRNKIRPTTL